MAFTAGFSVNVGDPTKASDVDVLAANDDYLKNAIDTFIANDANNRVLTATGSGTANAESNLTFDGSTLTVTGTGTFSGLISGNGGAEIGSNTAKVKFYSDSTYSGIYNGSSLTSDESYYFGSGDHFWYSDGALAMKIDNGDLAVDGDTLYIDASADRVGINTASPATDVHLLTSGSTAQLRVESGLGNYTQLNATGLSNYSTSMDFDSVSHYIYKVSGSEKMRLDTSGDLLVLGGTIRTKNATNTQQYGAIYGSASEFSINAGVNELGLYSAGAKAITIDSSQRVGISTVSPDGTLHVHTASAGSVTAHGSADDLVVESSADAGLSILTPAANNGRIYFGSPTNNAYGQIDYDHATNDMVFATAGSGKLTIDSAGNAGISTSSPVALSNQTSLTINGTSVGRVDVKASGGGGGVMFGTSSALTVQANSGVAINIDSASGQPITFQVGSSDKARIDASGNMALGVTPSAWRSTETALQVGLRAALYADSNVTTALANNLIINSGGYALIEADAASQYYQYQGAHVWQTVGSGSAGANVSPSTVMSLTSAGNLGLGTSSPTSPGSTGRFMQISNSSGSAGINLDHTTHNSWDIYNYQGALGFYDETATRMTLTSTGLGIGTASPSTKIHASGASSASALRLDESTSGANSYLGYLDTSGNFGIDVNGGGYLRFAVGGAERVRIKSTGAIEIPNQNAINELTFTGTDFTNVFSQTTSGMQFGTTGAGSYLSLYSANVEAIHIDSSQRVGIGSQSPTYKLVVSNGGAAGYEFNVNGLNSGVNTVVYNRSTSAYVDSAHFALNYYIFTGSTPAEVLRATSAGEVWIKNTSDQGSYNLQVGGTGVWGAGAYVNGSDERLKKSIATYTDNALDLVNQMRPVTFEYVEDYSDDRATQIGFIAQDLQKVLQGKEYLDGIVKDDAEHLNVAYQSLIPVLTKAIQELTARIEALEAA